MFVKIGLKCNCNVKSLSSIIFFCFARVFAVNDTILLRKHCVVTIQLCSL